MVNGGFRVTFDTIKGEVFMIRGFYTAAAGMLAQMQRQEMLTNNIANVNTPGYKADRTSLHSFPNVLLQQIGGTIGDGAQIGGISNGVYLQEGLPDFSLGPLKETGENTDIALVPTNVPPDPASGRTGTLLFAVALPNGDIRYTRNGHFNLDPLGRLTTADGYFVLDANGQPITLATNDFKVDDHGRIYENGVMVGEIGIAYAADPAQLVKEGNDLFRAGANGAVLPMANGNPAIAYSTKQGFLEQSNVQEEQAMTDLLMAYRTFEANQRVLKTIDHTMDLAVNQVGKIG